MFPLQLIKTLELDWLMELMVDKSLIELNGWTKLQMIQILIKALVCRITRLPYYVSKCWNCKRNCTDNNSLENNPFLFLIFFFFISIYNLRFGFSNLTNFCMSGWAGPCWRIFEESNETLKVFFIHFCFWPDFRQTIISEKILKTFLFDHFFA